MVVYRPEVVERLRLNQQSRDTFIAEHSARLPLVIHCPQDSYLRKAIFEMAAGVDRTCDFAVLAGNNYADLPMMFFFNNTDQYRGAEKLIRQHKGWTMEDWHRGMMGDYQREAIERML